MDKKADGYKWALAVLLFIFDFIITGFTTCYIWNSVMPGMFGLREITYWQGWALSLFVMYFKPKSHNAENADYVDMFLRDIIYTLIVALFMFLLVHVAGI